MESPEAKGIEDEEEAPVSTFVTAFYDAVILYALALNETLASKGSVRDGEAITKRMWNKTFTEYDHIKAGRT
ncbi:hypothetical protein J437_LFUL009436 [Ladona fulva]|uniref:Receptor ligand binding region domain-containing protein n=1 Tax=Ladona fulva TaxID=123851 RepID=A0A8K0JYU6_LADFU|nr:hypothetical protein J437_LFUL009436 [Ladona fulva]